MLDRIAGFKQYLSITERERLDRMQAPADSLQLFERYLPYAIALGVENRWADRYTGLLAAAAAAPGAAQTFGWYPATQVRGTTPAASSDSWLVAGEHDQLVIDRARLIERLGRRRLLGRRWRRRGWRGVVNLAASAGRLRTRSARHDNRSGATARSPAFPQVLIEGSLAGAMIAQIGVGSRLASAHCSTAGRPRPPCPWPCTSLRRSSPSPGPRRIPAQARARR